MGKWKMVFIIIEFILLCGFSFFLPFEVFTSNMPVWAKIAAIVFEAEFWFQLVNRLKEWKEYGSKQ